MLWSNGWRNNLAKDLADHAMAELGLGDVSIIAEWQRQRLLSPQRRLEIWSLDEHLQGYVA